MKRILFPALLAIVLLAACNSGSDKKTDEAADTGESAVEESSDANVPKRYLMKSGIVKYTLSGNQSGTETLYFDDYGAREAKFTDANMKMMGMEIKRKEIAIIDGEYQYQIDLEKKTGTRMKNQILSQMRTGSDDELIEYGKKMFERMGGKMAGTEDVLGRTCEVWTMDKPKAKTWTWKVIPLRVEVEMMDMKMNSVATSIEENASIPEDKFKIPDGITLEDYPKAVK